MSGVVATVAEIKALLDMASKIDQRPESVVHITRLPDGSLVIKVIH